MKILKCKIRSRKLSNEINSNNIKHEDHVLDDIDNEYFHLCEVCNQKFPNYKCLREHLRVHTMSYDIKSHGTTTSSHTIKNEIAYKVHKSLKLDFNEPYMCGVCCQYFSSIDGIKKHRRCVICGLEFAHNERFYERTSSNIKVQCNFICMEHLLTDF